MYYKCAAVELWIVGWMFLWVSITVQNVLIFNLVKVAMLGQFKKDYVALNLPSVGADANGIRGWPKKSLWRVRSVIRRCRLIKGCMFFPNIYYHHARTSRWVLPVFHPPHTSFRSHYWPYETGKNCVAAAFGRITFVLVCIKIGHQIWKLRWTCTHSFVVS